MKIIVLAGGLSTERDVSLSSAAGICRTLVEKGHDAFLLDVFMGLENAPENLEDVFTLPDHGLEIVKNISTEEPDLEAVKASRPDQSDCFFGPNVIKICQAADIVFMALHGENGENGKIQAAFDLFGIQYTGSRYLGSALAMDKGISKKMFEAAGIPTPHGIAMSKTQRHTPFSETGLTLPCVVKPCCGGSSIGVTIVRTADEYEAALDEAFKYEDNIVIESYICGREFSVGVIDMQALPVIEIAPVEGFYDYKNKYKAGSAVETCPADLPEEVAKEMQKHAVAVCRELGLDSYARMDFLLNENNEMFCLEANTLPGMTATSLLPQEAAVIGIKYEDLCERLIQISQEKYGGKHE